MQRVRIGLTGLASVFLLVLIGTASISDEAPAAKAFQREDPLAQLGVAPGSSEASNKQAVNAAEEVLPPVLPPVPITPPPAPVMPE